MATIGAHYVRSAINGAAKKGVPIDNLLRYTGINPSVLTSPTGRVDAAQMTRLIRNIWQQLKDEFMGFTPTPCKNGVFALMSEHTKHATTLRGLLSRGIHFYNLFTSDIQMTLYQADGKAHHTFSFSSPANDPDCFFTEFWMVIWHRFSSWYIGETIHLYEANFSYPTPDYLEELQFTFPWPLYFKQPINQLIFDQRYLDKPLIRSNSELTDFLEKSPEILMTVPEENKSLASHIKKRFVVGDALIIPTLEELSEVYSVTPQTLTNRLKKEGTSYQHLKDEVRREIAIEKLLKENISVENISAILGYKEARSFTRAFKRWTGFSPSSWQRHLSTRKL